MSKRKQTLNVTSALTSQEISTAEQLWLLSIQQSLPNTQNYKQLQFQLGLFVDDAGVIHSRGRLSNANLPYTTKCSALLPRNHYLTQLNIEDCHKRVNHCRVQDTSAELRWVVRARQLIKVIFHKCWNCHRLESKPFEGPPEASLPEFRVCETFAFNKVGVDYCGPLLIKTGDGESMKKTCVCLFTCTASRAVHLELVTDLTPEAFTCCLSCFCSRHGKPSVIISDNSLTFTASRKILIKLFRTKEVQSYLASKNIKWQLLWRKPPGRGASLRG